MGSTRPGTLRLGPDSFSVFVGSVRGLPSGAVRGHQLVRHPRQESHYHAQRHPASEAHQGRESLKTAYSAGEDLKKEQGVISKITCVKVLRSNVVSFCHVLGPPKPQPISCVALNAGRSALMLLNPT